MDKRNEKSGAGASNSMCNSYLPLFSHYNRFDGVRHGFNTRSGPDRAYAQWSPEAPMNSPTILPPLQNVGSFTLSANMPLRFENPVIASSGRGSQPSVGEDVHMTSMRSSRIATHIRRNSSMVMRQSSPDTPICGCPPGEPIIANPSPVALARDAFTTISSYPRIPINDLLNNSASPVIVSQSPLNQPARIHTANASNNRTNLIPGVQTRARSPISSSRTLSNWSPSTIRTPSRLIIEEERYCLLKTLYETCVDASATFIRSQQPVLSHSPNRQSRRHNRRFYPYQQLSSKLRRFAGESSSATASRTIRKGVRMGSVSFWEENRPVSSLMDNISTISSHLWHTARRDGMAPRQAEANAIRVMRDLYRWGEIVATGFQNTSVRPEVYDDAIEPTISSLASGYESELDLGTEACIYRRVGRSAKRICEWLRNGEAWDICQSVMVELAELEDKEGGKSVSSRLGGEGNWDADTDADADCEVYGMSSIL